MNKNNSLVKKTVLCAIMISLATVLSIFPTIGAPFGGSITVGSMFPIMLVSFLLGPTWGIPVAIGYSFIQLMLGFSSVASFGFSIDVFILCLFLDYVLAYSLLCTTCIFGAKTLPRMIAGTVFAGALNFLCHFLSGWLFFGKFAREGFSAMSWSLVYNGAYMIPETVICVIIAYTTYRMLPTFRKQLGIN